MVLETDSSGKYYRNNRVKWKNLSYQSRKKKIAERNVDPYVVCSKFVDSQCLK